jgi:hypothetical protein
MGRLEQVLHKDPIQKAHNIEKVLSYNNEKKNAT